MKAKPIEPVRGRPPLPVDEVRSVELKARVTEAERDRIQARAAEAGQSVSDYLRTSALARGT